MYSVVLVAPEIRDITITPGFQLVRRPEDAAAGGCDDVLFAKARRNKQCKLWGKLRAESSWLHNIPGTVQNKARLDSTAAAT
jgi:hypothetical protein